MCTEENKQLAEKNLKIFMGQKYPNMIYVIDFIYFSRYKGDFEALLEETTTGHKFIVQYLNIEELRSDEYEIMGHYTDVNGNLITSYKGAPKTNYK